MGRPYGTAKDISGQKFGRFTVIRRDGSYASGTPLWLCKCQCGNEKRVTSDSLQRGTVKSCGCYQRELATKLRYKHGHAGKSSRTYRCWSNMIQRCTNPNNHHYINYGGRGITVCTRWREFKNFLADMGECPAGLTIERKNNNKGYYKTNCRWATLDEQRSNKRPWGSSRVAVQAA